MRVLLLNQFYPPDVAPTGQALQDLARTLAARGHQVQVVCSRASYDGEPPAPPQDEAEPGVAVRRLGGTAMGRTSLGGKLADYASFAALLCLEGARGPRPDVLVCLTTPPYLGTVASLVPGWRGVARVEWVMDVYPEALAAHGALRRDGALFRWLAARSRRQLGGARAVIALGPFMARALQARVASPDHLTVVSAWGEAPLGAAPEDAVAAERRACGWPAEELVLLYSGNMGRGHRVAEFLEAASRLGPGGPRWVFRGGGARRAEVESFVRAHPQARVELRPYAPRAALRASLSAADVHLASLSAPWQGLIVPSKVQAAFAAARPVIFVGPRHNEAAAWTLESGGGWIVGEDDVAGLLAAVEAAGDAAERLRRGQAALAFARERFDPARNGERVAAIVEGAAGRPLTRASGGR